MLKDDLRKKITVLEDKLLNLSRKSREDHAKKWSAVFDKVEMQLELEKANQKIEQLEEMCVTIQEVTIGVCARLAETYFEGDKVEGKLIAKEIREYGESLNAKAVSTKSN